MMRYLSQEEKKNTISLWTEAFPEDSDSFLEYYYREKIKDNRILVAEEEESAKIVSMLHRNPYKLQVNKAVWEIDYIVGVATARAYRHRGLMKSLLIRMMKDMYQEGKEFCFLMPAAPEIYSPFDFVYIYDQPHWKLKTETGSGKKTPSAIGDWMNQWLEKRFQVYAIRTCSYIERLYQELESERGCLEVFLSEKSQQITGVRGWWGIDKKEQRLLMTDEDLVEKDKPDTPAIMARIIHLKNFLKAIHLKTRDCLGKVSLTVQLQIEDRICEENNGTFLWIIGEEKSELYPWEEGMEAEETLQTGIGPLTGYLFGYDRKLSQTALWTERIQTLGPVFLDEVV